MDVPHSHIAIVGGGISGLSAALFLQDSGFTGTIQVLEAGPRLGGLASTQHVGDFLLEEGPESISESRPSAVRLCERLGVELIAPQLPPDRTRMVLDGELVELPGGLQLMATLSYWPLIASPLLSWTDDERRRAAQGRFPMLDQPSANRSDGDLFLTPRDGMDLLVDELVRALERCELRLDSEVTGLRLVDSGWELELKAGEPVQAQGVILALPTPEAAQLLPAIDTQLATALSAIPTSSTVTVNLVWPRDALPEELRGSGFLAPDAEGALISYCSFVSAKYAGRADADHVALRAALRGQDELLARSDAELVDQVSEELGQLLGIEAESKLHHVARQARSIPDLDPEETGLLTRTRTRLADLPGLALAGNTLFGPGISNVIDAAEEAAGKVLGDLTVG